VYNVHLLCRFAELEKYTELDFKPTSKKNCDIIEKKPTVLIKLDAGVNLYHHYCDFYNLYASQHAYNSFSDDIQIVMWDTTNLPYTDLFSETWSAFSKHPLKRIGDYSGKRVCFKEAMFPLLPRMRGGLYYNTYILPGCEGSGMMMAFHKHLMNRLNIGQDPVNPERLRVTLLQRTTRHRQIVNAEELVRAMKTVMWFDVSVVDYKYREYPFLDQVRKTHNSDIFIGMHGAGLAHVMFLPDWAALFEIYNTDDPRCYHDLARQRGVVYATWEDKKTVFPESEGIHPTLKTPHAKFTNYSFEVKEFMRIIMRLAEEVRKRKRQAWKRMGGQSYATSHVRAEL
jgi:protein O-GlcNAc transferase